MVLKLEDQCIFFHFRPQTGKVSELLFKKFKVLKSFIFAYNQTVFRLPFHYVSCKQIIEEDEHFPVEIHYGLTRKFYIRRNINKVA